ncbi:squalene/phytoene synthase family protein [Dongia rigui]|uniref:Squalene/phytoene synthase family protein n=1 Tax=Dongia rigui TaxID=940149 RepID=A0ABU5DSV2_9PROT|nr:squalene/phytoene synthase family protein [Dongia rigui]MDY0870452.1 squalene/phytoene synthase family protein [Dongia rigui]
MSEAETELRVLEELRRADRDRFLCAIAAPAALRRDLATLYALNAELAGIADKVSEKMLGLIRLQWWRDALDDVAAGRGHRHHLVQELADLIERRHLDVALLRSLIDARERDVEAATPADLAELEGYAAASAGALAELALSVCTGAPPEAQRLAARQVGTAYGLVGIARATVYLAQHRRVMLPGVDHDKLLALQPGADVAVAVELVCHRASALLAAARKERLPRAAIPALFPGRLAAAQLERLRRHGYDPVAVGGRAPSGLDIWRLVLARGWGRI